MECPLCGNTFPSEKIEEHVNACLDTSAAPPSPIVDPPTPPKVIEPTPIITKPVIKTTGAGDTYEVMQQEHNHKKILIDETEEPDTAMPDAKSEEELNEEQLAKMQVYKIQSVFINHLTLKSTLQLEAYLFWERKKKQEEEDMRLAMELEKEPAKPTTTTTTPPPKPTPIIPTPIITTPSKPTETALSDIELARKLYEEEQRAIREAAKAKADTDRLLAEELWRKEKEEEEERKKKKEWDDTLHLIKQQAKAESDKELGTEWEIMLNFF